MIYHHFKALTTSVLYKAKQKKHLSSGDPTDPIFHRRPYLLFFWLEG